MKCYQINDSNQYIHIHVQIFHINVHMLQLLALASSLNQDHSQSEHLDLRNHYHCD